MAGDGHQLSPDDAGASGAGSGHLNVPSRSSSQQRNQTSAASTGLSGVTAADPRTSVDEQSKESQGSASEIQRNGSASTNRSERRVEQANTTGASQPSSPATSDQKKRKKKSGGLLSLFGCCGVPDSANNLEDGDNENVHKVEKLPQRSTTAKTRQPEGSHDVQPAIQTGEKGPVLSEASQGRVSGQASDSATNQNGTAESANDGQDLPMPPVLTVDSPIHEHAEPGEHQESAGKGEDVEMADSTSPVESGEAVAVSHVGDDDARTSPFSAQSPTAASPIVVTESDAAMPEQPKALLPPIAAEHKGRKCLVLDLDETLVHSSFKIMHQADITLPVEIEGNFHNVYAIKRPGVDEFMKRVGELYEVVVFTASVSKYGDPLMDQLDIHKVVHHRLFRESCYNHHGNYVKDLSQIGRDLKNTIIIDNSPTSYIFHPQHAIPISSWFSDAHDNELLDLIPVLEDLAGPNVSDVSLVLDVTL